MLRGSVVLKGCQCEMEIFLLALRTHCTSVEAASTLIQFMADVLLSSVQDYHRHKARIERILQEPRLSSLSSPTCVDDILSAPLEIPDALFLVLGEGDVISEAL